MPVQIFEMILRATINNNENEGANNNNQNASNNAVPQSSQYAVEQVVETLKRQKER